MRTRRQLWRVAIETQNSGRACLDAAECAHARRVDFSSAEGLRCGAYILADAPDGKPDIILIDTGSEVSLIVAARQQLLEQKIHARIVSMPSWELFDAQPQSYRDSVLPSSVCARLAVEAAATAS